MISLGFDPSKRSCGWAVFDGEHVVASGAETCPHDRPRDARGIDAGYGGLVVIWARNLARRIIDEHRPAVVAIERPVRVRSNDPQSQYIVHMVHGGLSSIPAGRGVLILSVAQQTWRAGLGIKQRSTTENKRNAKQVCRLFGHTFRTDDEAEAILIARWGHAQISHKTSIENLPLVAASRR